MKKIMKKLGNFPLILILTSCFLTLPMSSANAGELSVSGITLKWPDKMYVATECSRYDFSYSNNASFKVLNISMYITNEFADQLAEDAKAGGVANGASGTFNTQICSRSFKNAPGPYKIKLAVKDYSGGTSQVESEITFLPRPGATSDTSSQPSPTSKSNATTKKTTITCVKGSATKKVTAVKPTCPSGYKKK